MGTHSPSQQYPEIVTKNNKQQQYDLAKTEMYKISTRYDCACKAVDFYKYDDRVVKDTLNVISLDITLDTIFFKKDSITYLFSFYAHKKNNFTYTINIQDNNCPQYYGVEYLNDAKVPYRYLIAESSYIDRESISNFNLIDSSFYDCLIKNKKVANKWLLDYFNIK